ncbi:hypothetical protein E2C01_054793 [Portunus trituberculatus]|uniref:Uncharacterized protein n=1 Tax=Portunus trituberculatus TaxID=210409 RepID=A0A5B7GU85_PORTR|nr:hypothetical protein [Portunus trituberculatus]
MRCWNMTVQYWLANNVYKRLKLIKPVRLHTNPAVTCEM